MDKDVIVKIKGLQFHDLEDDEMEVIDPATYFERNGRHYIKYDEVMEGFDGTTQNLLKLTGSSLEVTKKGLTNVHMVFEENKKNMTYYQTPFGNLLVGIAATKVQTKVEQEKIGVEVDYALEVNYEHLADCKITMNIQPQGCKDKETHLLS